MARRSSRTRSTPLLVAVAGIVCTIRLASADGGKCPPDRQSSGTATFQAADFDGTNVEKGYVSAFARPLPDASNVTVSLGLSNDAPSFTCSFSLANVGVVSTPASVCDCARGNGSDASDGGGDASMSPASQPCAVLYLSQPGGPGASIDLTKIAGTISVTSDGDPFGTGDFTVNLDIPKTAVVDDLGTAHTLEIQGLVGHEHHYLKAQYCPSGCDCGGGKANPGSAPGGG